MRVPGWLEAGGGVACGEGGWREGAVCDDRGTRGLGQCGVYEGGGVGEVERRECVKAG